MTRARLASFCAAIAVSAAGCGACEPRHDQADAAGSAGTTSASPLPAASPPSMARPPHPPRLACRAIAVDGDVHVDTGRDAGITPLLLQGLVPTEAWLDLGKGARFVAKDPKTTRETTFRGPGHVRACVDYSEESWITAGTFESSPGAGEQPGAEEWVVSPLAVVRYSAAKLQVDVRATDAKVSVGAGVAFVWPADDSTAKGSDAGAPSHNDEGWIRVEDAAVTVAAAAPAARAPTIDNARAAVTKCESASRSAHDLTNAVMSGTADAGVVREQVTARRLARAACAVAVVRVGSLPASDAVGSLTASVASANAMWTNL